METYTHTDGDGDVLTINERDCKPRTALVKANGGVEVSAADLPVIVEKLYEACDLPSPVILERPSVAIPQNGDPVFCGDLSLRMYDGDISMGLPGITAAAISPDALRRRAAFMAAYADASEMEPDAAEVEELARAMHAEACTPACTMRPDGHHHTAARAALRWMNAKAARNA